MMYYQWETIEDFNLWHKKICDLLHYPEIKNGIVITDSYTKCFEYENKIIAYVEENYAEGLTPINYVRF